MNSVADIISMAILFLKKMPFMESKATRLTTC